MNMSKFSVQQAVEDFKSGRIDEWDLKREMQREYGSCSCVGREIDREIRNVEDSSHDGWDVTHKLESRSRECREEGN
jgi:hypothetical protein